MLIRKKFINSVIIFSLAIAFSSCKDSTVTGDKQQGSSDTTSTIANDTAVTVNYNNKAANEKILLKFQPEIGKTYYVENNSNYTSFQSMDTLKMSATSKKYGKVKLDVLSKDKNAYNITFTLIDARKTIKDDSTTVNYSYGKPLANATDDIDRQIEDCMVNSPLTLILNEQGEGTDIQGYETIIKKIKAIVGNDVPDEYIANSLGTPTDNLENYFVFYPDTAVKIGDTWSITTASALQGLPITLTNTYTLADRKDGIASINFITKVVIDKSQLPADVLSQMSALVFSAYVKGTGTIEEKTGWPIEMRISQSMEMKDSYQGHTTSTKQTSSSVIRRL